MNDGAQLIIDVQILPEGEGLALPAYMTEDAAGCDLLAAVRDDIVLAPGRRAMIPAGFCMELPRGVEAQIRPRSAYLWLATPGLSPQFLFSWRGVDVISVQPCQARGRS